MEEWRAVPDWPEYEVSSLGRIRRVIGRSGTRAGALLSPMISPAGYRKVTFRSRGRYKTWLVNRLVCLVFHGEPPTPDHHAAHRDGDSLNNRADNLRWATCRENHADKLIHGTAARGEKSPLAKLTEEAVREIRAIPKGEANLDALAAQYGVAKPTIKGARYGQKWKHLEQ